MASTYFKDIYNLLSKRHPNKKVYVISDHHFFHNNIIEYHRPNFSNIEQMNNYIINKHNSIIKKDDIVIFLGDFSFRKNEIKEVLNKMNGYKYLLLGNHDQKDLLNCYQDLGFEGLFINPVKINNSYLSHQPLNDPEMTELNFNLLFKEFSKTSGTNYHGHTHSKKLGEKPYINVCVEATDYKPVYIGNTDSLSVENKPLLINCPEFEQILNYLKEEKKIDSKLLISDYIYSMMLEAISQFNCVSYGSFPLYKKYGYISNFSDLDIGLIYDDSMSKQKNITRLKKLVDSAYKSIIRIDDINLEYYKRMANICIFEAIYSNGKGNIYKGYFDSNLVLENIYRDSDFIFSSDCTTLEKLLKYKRKEILENFSLPKFESTFLTINGDLANIILQILYQIDTNEKKESVLKKLNYIYRTQGISDINNVLVLEDIMIRFLIRNILFFCMTGRIKDIRNIINCHTDIKYFMENISPSLRVQMNEILNNPNSEFNKTITEISSIKPKEFPKKARILLQERKQKSL